MLFLYGKLREHPALHIPSAVLVIASEKESESANYCLNIGQQRWPEVWNSLCVMKCLFFRSDKRHLDEGVTEFSKIMRGMKKINRDLVILIM